MQQKTVLLSLLALVAIGIVTIASRNTRPSATTTTQKATMQVEKTMEAENTTEKMPIGKTFPAVAVVELFTSEGCSSCPPADAFLKTLSSNTQVFALAMHVTYWDRLGWRDSVSQKQFDTRQYAYSSTFNQSGVYTPQAIINGAVELVGSERNKMTANIQSALSRPATVGITLTPTRTAQTVNVKYQLEGGFQNAHLQLAVVEKSIITQVKRGENEGRKLEHYNVVRELQTIPLDKTGEGTATITLPSNWVRSNCSLIAYTQNKNTSEITGATRASLE